MRTKLLFTLFFLLCNCLVYGQMNNFNMQNATTIDIQLFNNEDGPNKFEGSPYIDDNFYMARINDFKDLYPVRYNASNDKIEVKINEKQVIALDHQKEDYTISFLESGLVYKTINADGPRGFFIELWRNDNLAVFKKTSIKFYPEKESSNGYSPNKPARYVRQKDEFYLQLDNELIEIPKKVGKLSKLLKNDLFNEVAKKNDLNITDESDLKKLFNIVYKNDSNF